ncbi:MAG: DUF3341 domain-containing protein [candidate division Zixibacteria bacterium]|nr:DUF3341 domain-containing protein [candidate division Zixibacteria bacterium]MBU1470313.1 DUF3341 domain-containing protein [candidate division Zixibacteria bacterium]MBU2624778.1 DUF3341 domain-containing protein [candidate division Zixibacteria bacterium]
MNSAVKKTAGILAEFENPAALIDIARKLRDSGYKRFDCHSPFPIHGMDSAMGAKRSPLGWIVGSLAICGALGGILLQWWTSAVNYPLVIAGKPFFSYPAFVPVTFGMAVLLGAISAVVGMLALSRLPMLNHPAFNSERFAKVTDDGFFVCIDSTDKLFDQDMIVSLLESSGGTNIEVLED